MDNLMKGRLPMAIIGPFLPDDALIGPRTFSPCPTHLPPSPDVKWCPQCGTYVSVDQFNKRKSNSDGLATYCRPCNDEWRSLRSTRDHEKEYRKSVRHRYKLTDGEFDTFIASHHGLCEICHNPPPAKGYRKRLDVDHDHQTGKVRGLLCASCNQALGYMRENPAILRAAADYLERHGK